MARLDVTGYQQVEPVSRNDRTVVHRAVRIDGGRRVILKSLAPSCTDPRARWRLLHEYSLLQDLEVPGVVRANRLVSTSLGLTLEADDAGTTNLRRLPGESLTLARFLDLAVRLSRIVASVHQRDISHRDINPANVIFDRASGEITLIDFGLGSRIKREATDVRPMGMLEGTIGYLSPEQTGRMNRSVDRRTDMYSLGVTFFEMLAGRMPFVSADPLALLHATVAVQAPPITDVRDDVPVTIS